MRQEVRQHMTHYYVFDYNGGQTNYKRVNDLIKYTQYIAAVLK